MSYCITVNGVATRIEALSDCFDVVFDYDSVMIQISKVGNEYKVTNAMNGWGNNIKKDYENAVVKVYAELNNNSGDLYAEALFDFLVFIREKNYHIVNADDKDLSFIVQRFLHKDEPELCQWCGDVVPNHKDGCKVLKSNIK